MIKNLERQWFFRGGSKNYFTSNNTMAQYGMELFSNSMRENHRNALKQFLEVGRCNTEITTEYIDLDLIESSSD